MIARPKQAPPASNLPGPIDGRYEFIAPLAKGGMGTVYRAMQKPIGREVAIKLLAEKDIGSDPNRAARRFLREARAIADLHHPHIVPLFDFGETPRGDRYLVMELLPGESLAALMRREGRFPLERAIGILDQLLDALGEAHAHGIVHRDLKPENIQVGRRGERTDFITVMDFGIARETEVPGDDRLRTTIEVAGTPEYMAPEQILGSAIDPRTDIYAVGVLLYEMVVGKLPFQAEKTVDLYVAHLRGPIPRLPEAVAVPGLQEILDRAMAKAAKDRLPDALSFRRALRSLGGSRTTHHTPPPVSSGLRLELVAALDSPPIPGQSPFANTRRGTRPETGVAEELVSEWAVDVAECGGTIHERTPGRLGAWFGGATASADALRAAVALKIRTRGRRLGARLPFYMRVGIHEHAAVAERLCEAAPRDGVVVADAAASCDYSLVPAGELRIRGQKHPVAMMQLVTPRT